MRCLLRLWIAITLAPGMALALGPHELAVLVNRNSPDSMALANHYAALRDIPPGNLVHLDLPDRFRDAPGVISPDDFRRYIYQPAQKLLAERGLGGHILAWAYSLDFPVRIGGEQPFSIQGLTFTRGVVPPPDQIREGTFLSTLYRGPDRADGPQSPTLSIEQFTLASTNMPLPSMMLGYRGSRGQTPAQALAGLTNSLRGDALSPPGWVYFIERPGDPRSDCRAWQYPGTQAELATLGVAARITDTYPDNASTAIGLMTGHADPPEAAFRIPLAPGAYAEHLTSFGADFINPAQTKATRWLIHGAAATSGTVIEPFANWAKFPHARLFSHYAAGCTMLEALYQAIRCPLQILLIGDPLAAPWKSPPLLTLINLDESESDTPLEGVTTFLASVIGVPRATFLYTLDGRPIAHPGNQPRIRLDTRALHDGYHELRVVAYGEGPVRQQASRSFGFVTRNRGRSVTLHGLPADRALPHDLPVELHLDVQGAPPPVHIAVIAQERVLARREVKEGDSLTLTLDPRELGEGPVAIQAVAVFPDQQAVRSRPAPVFVRRNTEPPPAPVVSRAAAENGTARRFILDPSRNRADIHWQAGLPFADLETAGALMPLEAVALTAKGGNGHIALQASGPEYGFLIGALAFPDRVERWETSMTPGAGSTAPDEFGVVFGYTDPANFGYALYKARPQAWTFGQVSDGTGHSITSRGVPTPPTEPQRIELIRQDATSLVVRINGDHAMTAPLNLRRGSLGWAVRNGSLAVLDAWVSPPDAARDAYRSRGLELEVAEGAGSVPELRAVAERNGRRAVTPIDVGAPPSP